MSFITRGEIMPQPHTTALEIQRAQDGIESLRDQIGALDALSPRLTLAFFSDRGKEIFDHLSSTSQRIERTIAGVFDHGTAESEKISKRTDLLANLEGLSREEMKKQIETNIAAAKDSLEEGVSSLQQKIAGLKGRTSVVPPQPTSQKTISSNLKEGKPEIFILRPTIWGVGVDLKAFWRKLRGQR
jgi:hypothetical protein